MHQLNSPTLHGIIFYLTEEQLYLEVNEPYPISAFVTGASDLSGAVTIDIRLEDETYNESVTAAAMGEYTVYVRATDAFGNETVHTKHIIADTPPQISFTKDIYAAIGYEIDYAQNVSVYDEHDGYITENVMIDASMVPADAAGDYYVSYKATDMYGLTTEVTQPIHIYSRDDLQALINTRQIYWKNQIIIGAYNLYDGGILFTDDPAQVMDHFLPAFVRLIYPSSFGSGFVIEITDSEIIICTNYHVVKKDEPFKVCFYNGIQFDGYLVGRMEGIDVAFVKVPIEDYTFSILSELKTVHINKGYVDSITNPTDVKVCFRTINDDASVWRDRTGHLLAVNTPITPEVSEKYPTYCTNVTEVTAFTAKSYGGSSGSAVLDTHGNLISMVAYHYDAPNALGHQYFGMTLEDILNAYEFFFGKEVHYE